MKQPTAAACSLLGLLLLSACTTYPLKMSEEEWIALPPDQQYQARVKQAELDEQAAQRRAAEKAREDALRRQQEQERRALVRKMHRDGRYGDIVQCIIKNPIADFHPGWREVKSVGFALAKTEEKTVDLVDAKRGRKTSVWAGFSEDGMNIQLCRHDPQERPGNQCDSFAATYNDFRKGISRNIDLPDILKGTIACSYAPAPGMPNTIIIERD